MKEYLKTAFGIDGKVSSFCDDVLSEISDRLTVADENAEYNQLKVMAAVQKEKISAEHLSGSTGYGYDDAGRDTLERVYADIFETEDALVRPQIVSGTHAINLALSGNLRPGDELLSPVGKPYDTMDEIIGIRDCSGSLKEYGVSYRQIELDETGHMDIAAILKGLGPKTRIAAIQRSKGYLSRPSFSVEEIGQVIRAIKEARPDVLCMVDNCYGEFTQRCEPSDYGADMTVGSLIKNPGGGLAPCGGYIAGTEECVENCAVRLTSPGLGREVGATMDIMRSLYQGFFLAPSVTASAVKGAIFAASLYEPLGFKTVPTAESERFDIIQAVEFASPEKLTSFCEGIQMAAPVDSYVTPEPWPMPGYDSNVIMAAGAFIQGSSIELSADGPLRAPFTAYFQGGLTWDHARFGIISSLQRLYEKKLLSESQLAVIGC